MRRAPIEAHLDGLEARVLDSRTRSWTEATVRVAIGDAAYERARALGMRHAKERRECPYISRTPFAYAWEIGAAVPVG